MTTWSSEMPKYPLQYINKLFILQNTLTNCLFQFIWRLVRLKLPLSSHHKNFSATEMFPLMHTHVIKIFTQTCGHSNPLFLVVHTLLPLTTSFRIVVCNYLIPLKANLKCHNNIKTALHRSGHYTRTNNAYINCTQITAIFRACHRIFISFASSFSYAPKAVAMPSQAHPPLTRRSGFL